LRRTGVYRYLTAVEDDDRAKPERCPSVLKERRVFFHPRYLSILTTRRCTAACDHCCVGASPRATQAIPVERIRGLIDEAKRIPSIELIGFTGGECFLLGTALDELVGRATSNGLRTRVITNGYWAVNARAARNRVAALRAGGLREMMLSTGTFHQRFVPVERVVAAARASASAGIATRISVETCDQSSFDEASFRGELADLVGAGSVLIASDAWTADAGGRGEAPLTHERLLMQQPDRAGGRCTQILNVVSVTPAQDLIACCGQPQEELPRLRLGSIADRSLDDVLNDAPPELLKMWLHVAGPREIARFVALHVPGFELPPAATICQACVSLQRDARAMRAIADHAQDVVHLVAAEFTRMSLALQPSYAPFVHA
jgi:hypothetical protein